MQVPSLGWEDPLEESVATHSSLLAWRIPWTEEPGGLQSMWVTKSQTRLKQLSTHTHTHHELKKKNGNVSSALKNRAAFWSDWLLSRHYILLFTDGSCVMFYCVF